LGALYRHRRLPAAAALLGVLLYTALVSSHVVSQASLAAPNAAQASGQVAHAGDPDCHEHASPGKGQSEFPASPKKKCPFCVGYAALHISILAGALGNAVFADPGSQPFASADAQLIRSAGSHSWRPRGPPAA
jgi:hypothetical protein